MAFCKALEISLYQMVFLPFRSEVSRSPDLTRLTESEEAKRALKGESKGTALLKFVINQVPLELGSMAFLLPLCRGKTAQKLELMGAFRDWLQEKNLSELYDNDAKRAEKLQELAKAYRNPAAHDRNFTHAEGLNVRALCLPHLAYLLGVNNTSRFFNSEPTRS
jgi:hypothetical protein